MSGGSYDYFYSKLEEFADSLRVENPGCPDCVSISLRRALQTLLRKLVPALRAIEWNDSGDGTEDEIALLQAVLSPAEEVQAAVDKAKEVLAELQQAIKSAEQRTKK